jgi:hypothetical protein
VAKKERIRQGRINIVRTEKVEKKNQEEVNSNRGLVRMSKGG